MVYWRLDPIVTGEDLYIGDNLIIKETTIVIRDVECSLYDSSVKRGILKFFSHNKCIENTDMEC